jgi:ribosome-binding protein aMBF1 (putative translation factor)
MMSELQKNPIQIKLASLQDKGWTIAALADELDQRINTLEKWKAGDRSPANEKSVLAMLDKLATRKRIPKKRRYARGSRKSASSQEHRDG